MNREIRMTELLQKARNYEEEQEAQAAPESRPLFHFSPRIGWTNDPNGFSWYNGQYHLFYQYYPYDTHWGPMHWGHAVSGDLLHWTYLPAALAPDQPYDAQGCFSGSALELPDGRHLLIYTGVQKGMDKMSMAGAPCRDLQMQCLAVGDGIEYEKYSGNPVIASADLPEGASPNDFRDPKIWRGDDGIYRCVVGSYAEEGAGQILLFTSGDAFHWSYKKVLACNENRYGTMWECPDFFVLDKKGVLITSPQDMEADGLEFSSGGRTLCLIGSYEEESDTFCEESAQCIDYGIDFYAPQTTLAPDGRRIMIGWMANWHTCGMRRTERPWFGQMTLPRELSIRNGRLIQQPVRELEQLRGNPVACEHVRVGEPVRLAGLGGRSIDMELTVRPADERQMYQKFALRFAADTRHFVELNYRPQEALAELDRTHCGSRHAMVHQCRCRVADQGGLLNMRIILDRYSAEVFFNDGEQVMTITFETDQAADGMEFLAVGDVFMDVVKFDLQRMEKE